MLNNFRLELIYTKKGSNKQLFESDLVTSDYEITVDLTENGLKLKLEPKSKIVLIDIILHYEKTFDENDRIFANGYQSWTTSREYSINDKQKGLTGLSATKLIRKLTAISGDYDFIYYPMIKGQFHSFTYSYIRRDEDVELIGSLSERSGYTVIGYNMRENAMFIRKDLEGYEPKEAVELFNLVYFKGDYDSVFDNYFEEMKVLKPKIDHISGYTSWYNYYGGISEAIIRRDLEGLAKLGDKAGIFQIDDGYQSKVGDWQTIKEDIYPSGMRAISDAIHSKGLMAGIWVAPFAAAKDSVVAKEHPDWLIRNRNGKKELGCVGWGGAYTLDIYVPEAREYIKNCFKTILDDWNFDLVKLDFLYAQCITPRKNKTRGQIMCEAMDFLRECVGDKLILGCGVPLGPAFGKVDLCRISCDVAKSFNDVFYANIINNEIPSTRNVITNAVFRRHLNGRVFTNDPDVFYLRENDHNKKDSLANKHGALKFTEKQRELLATINNMCGDVLFVSDDVGAYNEKQMQDIQKYFAKSTKKCIGANYQDKNILVVDYIEDNIKKSIVVDFKGKYE